MHSILKPAIRGFGYEVGDCFGKTFRYNEKIKITDEIKKHLLKYPENFSIYLNDNWESPTKQNIKSQKAIKAIRFDVSDLSVDEIIKLLRSIKITVLCLSNIDTEVAINCLKEFKIVRIKYLDVSEIDNFPLEMLKKFKNLRGLNLNGCNITKSSLNEKFKVFIDY